MKIRYRKEFCNQISPLAFGLIKKSQDYKCKCCGILEGTVLDTHKGKITIRLTQDHIIPRSKGGQTVPENIQALCFSCNKRKGSRIPYQDR